MMKRTAAFSLLALSLAGCVSVLPEPVVPDALYRFSSTARPVEGAPVLLTADVAVFEPEGSNLLLGRDIVFEGPGGELNVLARSEWSEPASRLLQAALLDRLSVLDPESTGVAVDERFSVTSAYELRWTIRDLVIGPESAVITARVTLLEGSSGHVSGQTLIVMREPYTGRPDVEGTQALISAARTAVDSIAVQLPDLMN
ncbi:ABC-type transport auxiliary lipoprotein family protein [Ponticaulis sp.]|uniref:ABC-type transport auxiliary lipoprotein family protein n=1 Tax=Ponticaulis sp. TaxID=2020902 RepID=UPI000B6A2FB2|nr:ABC-type transport auxiliary lipoprotein family protein [Ponticaulis sp.]MAI90753.1 hypothetical protein [Ponticaulis sp.]OUX98980.1 MAG: hypothetical protein CBB65_09955 [Hyphomonadaceae bacterium TMED5]|tara:strand:+ start:38000 stop:38599 length:600 start_codon:yes stop_codon:yes gene_type:complete